MNTYTKSFWGRSGSSISEDINKYIENCDSPIRITAMTTITRNYDDNFVIVAFEKIGE
jgi:hypothetical protein